MEAAVFSRSIVLVAMLQMAIRFRFPQLLPDLVIQSHRSHSDLSAGIESDSSLCKGRPRFPLVEWRFVSAGGSGRFGAFSRRLRWLGDLGRRGG